MGLLEVDHGQIELAKTFETAVYKRISDMEMWATGFLGQFQHFIGHFAAVAESKFGPDRFHVAKTASTHTTPAGTEGQDRS